MLAFSIAALVVGDEIDTVLQFTDVDEEVRELHLPDRSASPPAKTHKTLRIVENLGGKSTLPTVAERSDQSRSTVGRHLDELEESGAIETEEQGKTRHITMTLDGQLRLARLD